MTNDFGAKAVAIVGLVGNEGRHGRCEFQKGGRCGNIGVLSWSEMKCARSAIRVTQRVDFRGPPTARAADRLFMLPPFPQLAERCALIEVESMDKFTPSWPPRASASKIVCALSPAIETIVDRRVRAIVGWAIAPASAALKHVNDTADDASIVVARRAGLARWQMRLWTQAKSAPKWRARSGTP